MLPFISVGLFIVGLFFFLIFLDEAELAGDMYGVVRSAFLRVVAGAGFGLSTISTAVATRFDRRWRWLLFRVQIPMFFVWVISVVALLFLK